MAIKQILFNTQMVQAILEGRKTQTRRIIKGLEGLNVYRAEPADDAYERLEKWDFYHGWSENGAMIDAVEEIKAPYSVGDVMWARETWDKAPESRRNVFHEIYYYKADGDLRPDSWKSNWHPSIHMPKEAARIFLRVTNVHVERLQDITLEEVEAEGTDIDAWYEYDEWQHQVGDGCVADGIPVIFETLRGFYGHRVWDNTMQSKEQYEKYCWDANPWVWVIEFEQCEKPNGWSEVF